MSLKINDSYKGILIMNAIVTIEGIALDADFTTMTLTVTYRAVEGAEVYKTVYISSVYSASGGDISAQAYAQLNASLTS